MGRQIIRTGGPGLVHANARRAAIAAVAAVLLTLAVFIWFNAHRPPAGSHPQSGAPAAATAGGMGH